MKDINWEGLDTNVLVIADDPSSLNHEKAKNILQDALVGERAVCVTHQVLAEYFSVITSDRRVKHPLSAEEAARRVLFLNGARTIKKIHPRRSTLKKCMEFCAEHGIRGPKIFDAFYATALLDNHVERLVTQNVNDFMAFKNLQIENPFV